jgi:hypothetical protein
MRPPTPSPSRWPLLVALVVFGGPCLVLYRWENRVQDDVKVERAAAASIVSHRNDLVRAEYRRLKAALTPAPATLGEALARAGEQGGCGRLGHGIDHGWRLSIWRFRSDIPLSETRVYPIGGETVAGSGIRVTTSGDCDAGSKVTQVEIPEEESEMVPLPP